MIVAALWLACLAQQLAMHTAARLGDVAALRRVVEADPASPQGVNPSALSFGSAKRL